MLPELAAHHAVPFFLITLRLGAALKLMPFFGGGVMPTLPWLALTFGLSLAISPLHGDGHPNVSPDVFMLLALAVKELFIGVIIGTLARIAFSVMEMAGHITQTLALPIAPHDPEAGLATFFTLTGAAVFFLVGGHHSLIEGLSATVRCLPPTELPNDTYYTPGPVITLFTGAVAAAVLAAVPVFAAGIVSDIFVGGVFRILMAAPILGATTVRGIAVLVVAAATMGGIATAMITLLRRSLETFEICGGW